MYWDYDYPRAAPRPKPKPGKARKKFGTTWWGEKWVDIVSDYGSEQRMSRGRAYARADMVKNFKIKVGGITASVKGSMGKYSVSINFKKYTKKDWKSIIDKLTQTPLLLSKLLNNEMPDEIEEATGYSFVPESFKAVCSCPDYANPCKHIAAVFYTVADEIDYDPMILFTLRGIKKEQLFDKLGMGDETEKVSTKEEIKGGKKKTKKRAKKKTLSRKKTKTKGRKARTKKRTRNKNRKRKT